MTWAFTSSAWVEEQKAADRNEASEQEGLGAVAPAVACSLFVSHILFRLLRRGL